MEKRRPTDNPESQSISLLVEEAQTLAQQGQIEAARSLLAQATQLDPHSEEAWLWRAALAPDPWLTMAFLSKVLELNPHNPRAIVGLRETRRRLQGDRPSPQVLTQIQTELAPPPQPTTKPQRHKDWLSSLSQTAAATADFIVRRLGFAALVLLSIMYLTFFGLDMSRGQQFLPALSHAAEKTTHYLSQLAHGNLGLSTSVRTYLTVPVSEVILNSLFKSLGLLAVSLLLATIIGVTLGSLAARRRNSSLSMTFLLLSLIGVSLPTFFTALLLQLGEIWFVRTFHTQLVPVAGFGWDAHIILPALVLAARPIAQIFRVTNVSLSNTLDQDYVRTARSKGLPTSIIMGRHVYRNVAIPILTTVGLSLRFSLSSLPLVELFFAWPGAGFNLLRAIARQDDQLAVGLILCLGLLFITVNLILETLYRRIDPRLREAQQAIITQKHNWRDSLTTTAENLRYFITDSAPIRWLHSRTQQAHKEETPHTTLHQLVQEKLATQNTYEITSADRRRERRKAWIRATLGNPPFLLGSLILLGLIIIIIFGPQLAPHSPYHTTGLQIVDGQMSVPPFPPSTTYPWGTDVIGRDIMSLVIAGAQRTLSIALFVVLARLAIGATLGALAGWFSNTWFDRTVISASEITAAFPALLLAMTLILALGIRNGMQVFVIALCFVGWGEIMQFVRSEVQTIHPKPYIESAVATGLRTPQILFRHVLPNLISPLIALSALEMGSILMLLGELGFIGIFIGGGAYAELDINAPPYHYSDVPEWAALLSNVRLYARSYTWTAIYPAAAFFIAILGFNLFGEGLRKLVEGIGAGFTRLLNRTTLALATILIVAVVWVQGNVTPVAYWTNQARTFDEDQAMQDITYLASEELDGRALGTAGLDEASDYIASQYENAGLQAGGKSLTYFQPRQFTHLRLDEVPQLTIDDGGSLLQYRRDYAVYPGPDRVTGKGTGPVTWVGIGEIHRTSYGRSRTLDKLDFSDQVVMLLSDREVSLMSRVPRAGVLVVTEDPSLLRKGFTLSGRDPYLSHWGTGRAVVTEAPTLWISEEAANRILAPTGRSVADLRQAAQELASEEVAKLATSVEVQLEVTGTTELKTPGAEIVAHLPGYAAKGETKIDHELIMVLAAYDGFGRDADGTLYPGANDNASAVALMMEIARSWQESGYQPKRTFLFVNYIGEGTEYGKAPDQPLELERFLESRTGFKEAYQIKAIVFIRGVASPAGNRLLISTGGSMRLADLLDQAARRVGVKTHRVDEQVDLGKMFRTGDTAYMRYATGQEAPTIVLEWEGAEELSRLPEDMPDALSKENLRKAGQAIALALMAMGGLDKY